MVAELNHHIELVGENPLDARLAGRNTKAYVVAQFALADGAEATAEFYETSIGAVYAAMSFYEDNRQAIEQALQEVRNATYNHTVINASDAIAEFKRRMENK